MQKIITCEWRGELFFANYFALGGGAGRRWFPAGKKITGGPVENRRKIPYFQWMEEKKLITSHPVEVAVHDLCCLGGVISSLVAGKKINLI